MDTKSTSIIGLVILLVFVIGGALWYMSEHPAPVTIDHGATGIATSTAAAPPLNITDNGKYYDATASYPSKTPLSGTANAKAVEIMHQFALTSITSFKERGNFDHLTAEDVKVLPYADGRKEAFDMSYTVAQGPHTVSYIFTMFEDTFGAHPNTYYRMFTFDLASGNGIELSDLFTPGTAYLSVLSKDARAILPKQLAAAANTSVSDIDTNYIISGTTPDADNFQNWYIDGDSLVILFSPYQVAAYVFGAPEVRIPLASLPGLRSAYK